MKITIDTNEDKPEDIRKIVAFLSSISDKNYSPQSSGNIFEDSSPSVGNMLGDTPAEESKEESTSGGLMSMFGSDSPAEEPKPDDEGDNEEEEKADEGVDLMTY